MDYGEMPPYDHAKAQAGMQACFDKLDELGLTLPERFYAARWMFLAYAAGLHVNFEKLAGELRGEYGEMAEKVARQG